MLLHRKIFLRQPSVFGFHPNLKFSKTTYGFLNRKHCEISWFSSIAVKTISSISHLAKQTFSFPFSEYPSIVLLPVLHQEMFQADAFCILPTWQLYHMQVLTYMVMRKLIFIFWKHPIYSLLGRYSKLCFLLLLLLLLLLLYIVNLFLLDIWSKLGFCTFTSQGLSTCVLCLPIFYACLLRDLPCLVWIQTLPFPGYCQK